MSNEQTDTLETPLTAISELGSLGSAGARLVHADRSVWLVEHGSIDLFMVPLNAELEPGARIYLFTTGVGQLVAFPRLASDLGYGLLAVPMADCRYRVIERDDLTRMFEQTVQGCNQLALLDAFAHNLSLIPHEKLSSECLSVYPNDEYVAADTALTVCAGASGLWLSSVSGPMVYAIHDASEHELMHLHACLPAPMSIAIHLPTATQVHCYSLEEAREQGVSLDMLLDGLDSLFLSLIHATIENKKKNEADELLRLQTKTSIDSQAMSDALGGFASLFQKQYQESFSSSSKDRLLNACQIIGKSLNITFVAPPVGGVHRNLVQNIANASHVRTRVVALKGAWWKVDSGALLGFLESDKEPLALMPVRGGGYEAVNPVSGQRTKVDAQFSAQLVIFAHMFYTSLPHKSLILKDVIQFITRGFGREFIIIAAISLVSAALGMGIPIASGVLFDQAFPAADFGQMMQILMILFATILVTLLFEVTQAMVLLRIEGKASCDLQAAVWDRVLKLPVPFFRDYSAGDLATRINGINEIRQALSGTVISSILSSLFSALNVCLLFYYDIKLGVVAIILVLAAIGFNLLVGRVTARLTREAADKNGKISGMVLEYLNGIAKLRITGAESRAFSNWSTSFVMQRRLLMRASGWGNIGGTFSAVFPLLAMIVIFVWIAPVAGADNHQHLSTGEFIAFSSTFAIFLGATMNLVRISTDLLNIMSTYERTRPIMETVPEVDQNKAYPGELRGAIELSNVSFSYSPDLPPVLDDVSFSVKPGEFVALVGASGSGKSTLLRLMLGFETPSQGAIYYDGKNLGDINIGAVRRQLGVVLQGGQLMDGDIFSNIVGSTTLGSDAAWEAAKACGLDRDIEAMAMGMQTLVSDGGGTLSGGQRQRLMIARAIVNKPKIIYFDEATSALDNQTQATVSASMEQLRATRIVIAHRLSTIINADQIYVLEKGRIVQSGSYAVLMQQEGLFAELAKRQTL
ncbi:NHLP bacteriocin export ABC transporter permease/ATPase subunit [Solimicrobium silvestre]|uniref:Cyclolysin secretion/processing ATP-binding protein CyaB n=1 Tax=Solimicrobium silvestre TaxID=2099400 RepID=A0A2S9GYL0_9BURK|nr:NHLP bacteriocin export ABC transporter permease/ATPase subunit [Solimicrobium silvestre]PRC92801.1 NHLM bacteriocin system ABC transporter, ATP-binding protein [Solimicrobium silvestre]